MNRLIIMYATTTVLSLKFKDIVGDGKYKDGDVVRPTVKFTPNWNKVFTGESITITCVLKVPEKSQNYLWYKDSNQLQINGQMFTIGYTKTEDTGDYQCQTPNSDISESVRLEVIYGYLILQVPAIVYEEEDVFLKCTSWPGYSVRRTLFYKDKMEFLPSDGGTGLLFKNIKKDMAGKYRCVKKAEQSSYATYSDESFLHVRELFSNPVIKVTPNPALEGDEMTLTCYTNIIPFRQTTKLLSAFYKDGRNIQGFSPSNKYGVQSVNLEDSGKYSCVVETMLGNVGKKSLVSYIQVHELFSSPVIKVTPNPVLEGDDMILTCYTNLIPLRQTTKLLFAFYRDGQNVQGFSPSNKFGVQSLHLEDSGKYSCTVETMSNNVKKESLVSYITVHELFSDPLIHMTPNQTTEGDNITLTCGTSLSQHRQTKELLFAFYKEGCEVQGFNSSNKYQITYIQVKDSGNYSCEVKTSTNSVRKVSQEIQMQVQGAKIYELQNIVRLAISSFVFIVCWIMIIKCC